MTRTQSRGFHHSTLRKDAEIRGWSRLLVGLREVFTKLHKASRRFGERLLLGQTMHRQHLEASQFSACEGIIRNTFRCFWLRLIDWFGLSSDADVTSMSERPTDYATFCSTPFLSCLAASIIWCRAWMLNKLAINKCIRVWKVHNWIWDPTNPKHINRPRWSGKMYIIGKLFDWPG